MAEQRSHPDRRRSRDCRDRIEHTRLLCALEVDGEILQRRLEQSERQHNELKVIYDTAPIGLAYFDLDNYHYVRLNSRQAAFFGLQPEQMVGKTLTELAPIPGLRELFDQVAEGIPVMNHPLEGVLATDPKEYRYWRVSYGPVYGSDGRMQGITAASQEITEQKRAENALIQSEKLAAVGRFAASMAHEINNPLAGVTNILYLAQTSNNPDEVRSLLQSADTELRRVSAIAVQMVRFHRQSGYPRLADFTRLRKRFCTCFRAGCETERFL